MCSVLKLETWFSTYSCAKIAHLFFLCRLVSSDCPKILYHACIQRRIRQEKIRSESDLNMIIGCVVDNGNINTIGHHTRCYIVACKNWMLHLYYSSIPYNSQNTLILVLLRGNMLLVPWPCYKQHGTILDATLLKATVACHNIASCMVAIM